MSPAPPVVIAHRGASGTAPENTMAALRRALDLGAGWAEVDVQRTADGVLVLVHDDTWERTAGDPRPIAAVSWDEVRRFDAGGWFGAAHAGEPPPRLADALDLVRDGLRLDVEIKSPQHHPGLLADVVAAVRDAGVAGGVVLSCFDVEVVEAAAGFGIEAAYLAARRLERTHADVRCYILHHAVVTGEPDYIAALQRRGARIWAWTVDDGALGATLVQAGAGGLITNHPERFLAGRA